jgi:ribonuclease HI
VATTRAQISDWDATNAKSDKEKAIARQRHLIASKPKLAHRQIFRTQAQTSRHKALKNPSTGNVTDDPEEMKSIIKQHFTTFQKAPEGPKTGQYLPSITRAHPWEKTGCVDPFTLETPASTLEKRPWLHTSIADKAAFAECIATLSNGKAPGPDGVINETLKALPAHAQECIHTLFIIMWATGNTPDVWKNSHTTLLHKGKMPESDIKGYRPIALLNTMYKLWTKLLTTAMYDFAENHSLLSSSQKGFRKAANTEYLLQALTMALEDARLTGQDIYLLLVDFSSAFNMINHDKLLTIMYDLGFPTDAIDAVKNLYDHATTQIKWDGALTDPIAIDRGSIQGDSLSPFLFLIYIEPLLRWLHVGSRGYMFGALPDTPTRITNQISSAAYADDLAALTRTLSDLKHQADKVTQFADWGNMPANVDKTLATAALYSNTRTGRYGGTSPTSQVRQQIDGKIMVQRKPVTFLDPKEPFTYLGVDITMTLDWRPQHQKLLSKTKEKLQHLNSSYATPEQKQKIIDTAIKTAVAYALCVTPCSPNDIKMLDNILTTTVKRAHGLPRSSPTAMVHEDVEKFGLGCTSLAATYAHRNAVALIEALRDEGKMGTITKAVLDQQLQHLGSCTGAYKESKYCLRARQLAIVHQSKLEIYKAGTLQFASKPEIVCTLSKMTEEAQADLSFEFLLPLFHLGITHLGQLVEPSGKYVIQGAALKKLIGRRCAHKHVAALNRLAKLLHSNPADRTQEADIKSKKDTSPHLDRESRRIHPSNTTLSSLALNDTPSTTPIPVCADPDQNLITEYLRRHTPGQPQTANNATEAQDNDDAPPNPPKRHHSREHQPGPHTRHTAKHARPEPKRTPQPNRMTLRTAVPDIQLDETKDDEAPCPCQSHNHKKEWAERLQTDRALRHLPEPTRAMAIMERIYGHTNRISHIAGWSTVAGKNKKRARGASARGTPHIQYLVHWQPTFIEQWALEWFSKAGYAPVSVSPIDRKDLCDEATICESCSSTTPSDDIRCTRCYKTYHLKCLGSDAPQDDNDQDWKCPACNNDPEGQPPDDLVQANWEPSWEPEANLAETQQDMITQWKRDNHGMPPARASGHTLDTHLSNLARQGFPECQLGTWKTTLGDKIRSKVRFVSTSVNPQADITGSGQCRIEVRNVDSWTGDTSHPSKPKEMACIYFPTGVCAAMCTPHRLSILKTLFDGAKSAGLHDTISPTPLRFEEEVLDLFLRAQPGHKETGSDPKNTWNLHPALRGAITTHLGATKDRFATPLSVTSPDVTYWSKHDRDTVFGAQHQTFSCQWKGTSVAFPGTDAGAIDKAVRWALWSAKQAPEATATLLAIPCSHLSRGTPGYCKRIQDNPDYCQHIITIPHKRGSPSPLWRDDIWLQKSPIPDSASNKDLKLILISNRSAQAHLQHMTREAASTLLDDLRHAHLEREEDMMISEHQKRRNRNARDNKTAWRWLSRDANAQNQTAGSDDQEAIPKTFLETKPETPFTRENTPQPTAEQLRKIYTPSPLAHDWRSMAYTDGSRIATREEASELDPESSADEGPKYRTGAGLFTPADSGECMVDPGGTGASNTINRAELAGICAALQRGQLTIATDSACSMAQIRRALLRPGSLGLHKHAELLGEVTQLLSAATGPVLFLKVKSHNGIIGNEMADEIAKRCALRRGDPNEICTLRTADGPSYCKSYWLHQPPTQPGDSAHPIDGLKGPLQDHMHKHHRLGHSNQDSVYFQSWQKVVPLADGYISNAYKRAYNMSRGEQIMANKYRTGQLWNRKTAHRWGLAPNPLCPLCGQMDGGHHMVSDCKDKRIQGMVAERHNDLGRTILHSISKGERGGDIKAADVGNADKLAVAGCPSLPHNHVPKDILPTLEKTKLCKLKPDILLLNTRNRQAIIVEVKTCRDTTPADQLEQALAQHTELKQLLSEQHPGLDIITVPILIGVSGTIYRKHTLTALETLGLSKAKARTCAAKLHVKAIHWLSSIVRTRRMLEHQTKPP